MSEADQPPSKSMSPAERIRAAGVDPNSEKEQDLWAGVYSPKAMYGQMIAAAAISVVALLVVVLISSLRNSVWAWLGLCIAVVGIWVYVGGHLLYRRLDRSYELTTQRFKHRSGILTRTTDRIELIDIDDVRVRQGPIQSIFGVGNIYVNSSDETHPEFVLVGIDDAKAIADLIDDARRTERRKRGLHIEAI